MLDRAEENEVEEIVLDEPETDETSPDEQSEQSEAEAVDDDQDETEEEEGSVVTFGDDDEPEKETAPQWVRDLRKENRKLKKELSEAQKQAKSDETPALGAEPKIEDFDYDADKFKDALREYDARKAKIAEAERAEEKQREEQENAWKARHAEYEEGRSSFNPDDFEAAEDAVKSVLDETQQGILVHAFGSKAAPLIMGLGANDARLKELAEIKDPVLFTREATRLEASMKVTKRKPKTSPETRVSGNAAPVDMGDKKLEQLEKEADRTGDRSKIIAYKRAQRQANKG